MEEQTGAVDVIRRCMMADDETNNEQIICDLIRDLKPHELSIAERETGWTMLHAAVVGCRLEAVNLLLSRGADIFQVDKAFRLPYELAKKQVTDVKSSAYEASSIEAALWRSFKPQIFQLGLENFTALLEKMKLILGASKIRSFLRLILQIFKESFRNINESETDAYIKALLAFDNSFDMVFDDGQSAIDIACRHGLKESAIFLFQKGFKASVKDVKEFVNRCVDSHDLAAAEIALNSYDVVQDNMLFHCLLNQSINVANMILSRCNTAERFDGAHLLNAVDEAGDTMLHRALKAGNTALVRVLVGEGNDMTGFAMPKECYESNKAGDTIFHLACRSGNEQLLERVMVDFYWAHSHQTRREEAKGYVSLRNNDGHTPLYLAIRYGTIGMVEALIKKGADVNEEYEDGLRPLHVAALFAKDEAVVQKLARMCNWVDEVDENNHTALDLARKLGRDNIVQILERNGAVNNATYSPSLFRK